MRLLRPSVFVATLLAAFGASIAGADAGAAVVTLSGRLDDATNTALVGSGPAPSAPQFGDVFAVANNVAVYALSLTTPGTVRFRSTGFALGGADPYFSVFAGTGSLATFVVSNFGQAFSTGGDFDLVTSALSTGPFTVAIGAFANLSFAENLGSGRLGDGFIGLGEPSALRSSFYAVEVTLPDGSTGPTPSLPEPSVWLLLVIGLPMVLRRRRERAVMTIRFDTSRRRPC